MSNPIIQHLDIIRPKWRDEPELNRVVLVLRQVCKPFAPRNKDKPTVEELCDALGEAMPEQREFWLRVDATEQQQFLAGMTAMFEMDCDAKGGQ